MQGKNSEFFASLAALNTDKRPRMNQQFPDSKKGIEIRWTFFLVLWRLVQVQQIAELFCEIVKLLVQQIN